MQHIVHHERLVAGSDLPGIGAPESERWQGLGNLRIGDSGVYFPL
jgi:hypothetical protein